MAEPIEFVVKNGHEFILDLAKVNKAVRVELGKAVFQASSHIVALAKNRVRTIRWVTKGGVWRGKGKLTRTRGGARRRISNDDPKREGGTYYPAGSQVVGHVVTGDLADRIAVFGVEESKDKIVGIVGSPTKYAPYVEKLPDGGFLEASKVEGAPVAQKIFETTMDDLARKLNSEGV